MHTCVRVSKSKCVTVPKFGYLMSRSPCKSNNVFISSSVGLFNVQHQALLLSLVLVRGIRCDAPTKLGKVLPSHRTARSFIAVLGPQILCAGGVPGTPPPPGGVFIFRKL